MQAFVRLWKLVIWRLRLRYTKGVEMATYHEACDCSTNITLLLQTNLVLVTMITLFLFSQGVVNIIIFFVITV